jgi:hypothetical protein
MLQNVPEMVPADTDTACKYRMCLMLQNVPEYWHQLHQRHDTGMSNWTSAMNWHQLHQLLDTTSAMNWHQLHQLLDTTSGMILDQLLDTTSGMILDQLLDTTSGMILDQLLDTTSGMNQSELTNWKRVSFGGLKNGLHVSCTELAFLPYRCYAVTEKCP